MLEALTINIADCSNMCIGNRVQCLPKVVDTFNCTMYKRHDFVLFFACVFFCFLFDWSKPNEVAEVLYK